MKTEKHKLSLYKNIRRYKPNIIKTELCEKITSPKEINFTLLKLGFSTKQIYNLSSYYQYKSLEEALDFFNKNEGKFNHEFFSNDNDTTSCGICLENKESHHNLEIEDKENKTTNLNASQNFDNVILTQYDTNKQTLTSLQQSIKNQDKFEDNVCCICFKDKGDSLHSGCNELICKTCFVSYFETKIKTDFIKDIECPACYSVIDETRLSSLLGEVLIEIKESEEYKKIQNFLNLKSKQDIVPCIIPDCNENIIYNELSSKYLECKNNHNFCFNCKSKTHNKLPCTNIIKEKQLNNDLLYRICFNCGIVVKKDLDLSILSDKERKEGENKFICQKCSYHFCKFCNERVDENHFSYLNLNGCAWASGDRNLSASHKCIASLFFVVYFILNLIAKLLFGASIEFSSYAYEWFTTKDEEINRRYTGTFSISELSKNPRGSSFKKSSLSLKNIEKSNSTIVIILLLSFSILMGLLTQPMYLIYKLLNWIVEAFKFYGIRESFYDEDY